MTTAGSYFSVQAKGSFVNNLTLGSLALGALRRCESLVWLATRRASRLASHPNPATQYSSYFLTNPNLRSKLSEARRNQEIIDRV